MRTETARPDQGLLIGQASQESAEFVRKIKLDKKKAHVPHLYFVTQTLAANLFLFPPERHKTEEFSQTHPTQIPSSHTHPWTCMNHEDPCTITVHLSAGYR